MKYSYKKTNLRPYSHWGITQKISNFSISEILLNSLSANKVILSLDESCFSIEQKSEYGYSKLGERCYKAGQQRGLKVHFMVSLINSRIFSFQLRKGPYNQFAFLGFLIQTSQHIINMDPDFARSVVIYMDQAALHSSALVKKFLKVQQFTTVFNSSGFSDLMPVENIHGYIKSCLKEMANPSLYFSLHKNSDKIAENIHKIIASIYTKTVIFCHLRVLEFVEKSLRDMTKICKNFINNSEPISCVLPHKRSLEEAKMY